MKIGIGFHMGALVLSEIGNAGHTASRLEAKTKELGLELLVSAPVLAAAGRMPPGPAPQDIQLRGLS